MPKPDPALLDPARYPFSSRIEPRFGDLDVNLHINNVAMAGFLEDGRVRFHRESGYRDGLAGLSSMIVSVGIEYLGEAHYPDPVTIHCAVEDTGRTSHRLIQLVTQDERVVAFCRSTMVTVSKEGPAPLPAGFTEQTDRWRIKA
ncbi:thioesterase family protein [Novosphingobium sp. AP12]|uniref:acyl-CoA thioesterase n=1 Tax=Novosphingobium sp. AP12 TaxID=1144305 RepID=UPI000271E2D4|nr:acyl-CoA thioesterase [Novosphingobium sp. AP12]EJL23340.1 putative thioesterase [Novosphingobium sp. AP12]